MKRFFLCVCALVLAACGAPQTGSHALSSPEESSLLIVTKLTTCLPHRGCTTGIVPDLQVTALQGGTVAGTVTTSTDGTAALTLSPGVYHLTSAALEGRCPTGWNGDGQTCTGPDTTVTAGAGTLLELDFAFLFP